MFALPVDATYSLTEKSFGSCLVDPGAFIGIIGDDMATKRNRLIYSLWIALVIVGGLLWRSGYVPLPASVSKYGGDALWSLVVFLGFGFLFPRSSTRAVGITALLFSFAVETSQLYQAPWIDSIRQTRLGALALGSVFNWPDFAAYALGVMLGAIGEVMAQRNWLHRRQAHV